MGKAMDLKGISKIIDDIDDEAEVPDTAREQNRLNNTQQANSLNLSKKVISINLKTPVSHNTHFAFDKEHMNRTMKSTRSLLSTVLGENLKFNRIQESIENKGVHYEKSPDDLILP